MIDKIVPNILNTECENKIQIININSDSVLIFKLKGKIMEGNDIVEKTTKKLEEKIGCKICIIDESIELIKVLNKENKQDDEEENTCPKIESETIIALYKADIFEYGSGRTEISYVCDKDRNKECAKNYCTDDCCTHTLDKKYAKNFIES